MTGYSIVSGSGHLGDDTLVAIIDRERGSTAAALAHLGDCAACASRLAALRDASAMLTSSLPSVSVPALTPPIARTRARWLSYPAVAAATLLLASVATATPVREWIVRQFSPPPAPVATDPTPRAQAGPAATSGMVASFVAVDSTLVIRVESPQATGALVLNAAGDDRISAQAVSGATEEFVVLPGQLRIVNSAGSTTDYHVSVPASVRTVSIVVSGRRIATVRHESPLNRRIPLR